MIQDLLNPLVCPRFLEDHRYRNGHLRVINALSDTKILGVHIPELKKLAKDLSKRSDAADLLVSSSRNSMKVLSVSKRKSFGDS